MQLASGQEVINALEKKLKESEEKIKSAEKTERNLRSVITKTESKVGRLDKRYKINQLTFKSVNTTLYMTII